MFEHKTEPLLPRRFFVYRLIKFLIFSLTIIVVSVGVGTLGYRIIEGYTWLDAFLNASMILSGMGMVDRPATDQGKLFASIYALFSGVVFLAGASVLIAPIAHRIMHRLHLQQPDENL